VGGTCAQPHRAAPMSTVNFELLRLGTSSRWAHGDDVLAARGTLLAPGTARTGRFWHLAQL
jgi:hypothetical protein